MSEENTPSNEQAGQGEQEAAQQAGMNLAVKKIYLKDYSFESPDSPAAFQKPWKPESNLDLNSKNGKVADDHYEVVLTLTLTAKLEGVTAYIVEVQQAAVFFIKGLNDMQLAHSLNTFCLHYLFPYAREAVDSVLVKGGFPPAALAPVNFDAIFAQAVQKNAQKEKEGASEH